MNDKKDIFDKIMSLPLLNYWMEPYKKYKEILLYLFFGGLTSVVSLYMGVGFVLNVGLQRK